MSVTELPIISAVEQGRRLKQLRDLANCSQEELALAMGYAEKSAAAISKFEAGKRMSDDRRRKGANFLATRQGLTSDAYVIEAYLLGDHNSIDRCMVSPPSLVVHQSEEAPKFKSQSARKQHKLYFGSSPSDLQKQVAS